MARRILTPDGAFCSVCGSAAGGDALRLCPACGDAFEGDVPGTKCHQCGRVVDGRPEACPTCGMPIQEPSGAALLEEIKAFREQGRMEAGRLEQVPSAMPEETEASLLAELESLWKLSEPFEQVMVARRKRLEQMDHLIAAARRRVRELEESDLPAEVREREELKKQVAEVTLERDEILKIEYGITEMERIYRNIITMQQKELRAKEEALRARLEGFRKEIGERDRERLALLEREKELAERERELQARVAEWESGRQEAPQEPGAEEGPKEPAASREQWMAAQKEVQEALLKLRGSEGEFVLPTASNIRDLRVRVTELEEAMEKITEEKQSLEGELGTLRGAEAHVREVLKEVDDLLGKLPDEEIKRFARSEAFKRYEELMERLGL